MHPGGLSIFPLRLWQRLGLVALLGLGPAAAPARAQIDLDDPDFIARERARGWVPPTPEDVALYQSLGHRLETLHLNALALRRLHEADLADTLEDHALLIRRVGRGSITRPLASDNQAADSYALDPGFGIGRLPRFVDNSTLPCFPPIFDQGRLGSCTAVVSTYYQLTHTIGLMRGWDQSRLSNENRFSPAWTYNLTNNGDNTGVSLMRVYSTLAAHGAVSMADFPYRGSPVPATNYRRWPDDPELWRRALANRVDRFGLVDARDPRRFVREMKRLLLNGHLLTAATAIDGWNRRFAATPPGEPRSPREDELVCTRVDPDSPMNHAVTIVGYDDDLWVDLNGDGRAGPGERGAFKIVNSWGRADWNRGFRWLHYAAVARLPGYDVPAEGWRGAFWLDRVFWLLPYRYYQPARILELEVAPALRSDICVVAGSANAPGAAALESRIEAPNLAFVWNGGPYGFAGTERPGDARLRLNLDITPALVGAGAAGHQALFLRLAHPAGPSALRDARLLDPLTGKAAPVALGTPEADGTRWGKTPRPPDPDAPGPRVDGLPVSVALTPGQPVSLTFTASSSVAGEPVKVQAFSSRSAVITAQEIFVTDEGGGRYRLDLYPRAKTRGSALVLVHATDGWTRSTTPVRVNLETEQNTAPVLTPGATRRDGDRIVLPLRVADDQTAPEKITVYFDTPQVDDVLDFAFSGRGAERELTLRLRPGSTVDLSLSAFDGELIGEACVRLRGGDARLSALSLSSSVAAKID